MSETKIQVGDWGTEFIITISELIHGNSVPVDISAATDIKIWFKQYGVVQESVAGTFYTDGTDGKITYTLQANVLDTPGPCNIRVELTFGLGGHWFSNWATFPIGNDPT